MNKHSGAHRVVVTGMGVVSPLGLTATETWENILIGKSGAGPITHFDATQCSVRIAAEVKNFEATAPIAPLHPTAGKTITQAVTAKDARRMGRFVHLSLRAGLEAYHDSGIDSLRQSLDPERMGVNIGVGIGGLAEIEAVHKTYLEKGFDRITPFFITQVIANMPAGYLSIMLNLKGHNSCNVSACTSSAQSIGESFRSIQRGDMDWMLAGGAESTICPLAIGGFASMRALSNRNHSPHTASRPFDKDRNGFLIAEGSACLILEDLEYAKKRNAKIYAEILGYGTSSDAFHITATSPQGDGGARSMVLALKDAKLNPSDIDYVNSHSTSTTIGDIAECQAIASVFASAKKSAWISGTKSMTGHLLGAAGALEAFLCIMSIQSNCVPGTINLDTLDPEIASLGLEIIQHTPREKTVHTALSNSFGFGGTNASLIFKKFS